MTRWTRRLLLVAVAVVVPALAGCEAGLNAPTLEYHPANFGANTTVNGVAIHNAFVLGPPLNSTLPAGGRAGLFVAFSATDGDRLLSVAAPGVARSVRVSGGPVTLPPAGVVLLTGPSPQIVLNGLTSPLAGGESVRLTFVFARAGAVPLDVPVQPRAYQYATFSPPPRSLLIVAPRSSGRSPGTNPTAGPSPSP